MAKYIINDTVVSEDQAFIHVSDLALLRGYGIFDFFRTVGYKPLFLEDHIIRFFNSADALRLKCPVGKKKLKSMIFELIEQNKINNSGFRLVLTGGASPNGYNLGNPTLLVINEPINPLPESHFNNGVKLISYEYLRDVPEIKTTNYLIGIKKMPEIHEKGAVDLLYHWQGKISEATRSNFFIVDQNDTVCTAGTGILKGINRQHVLNMAKKHFKVKERDIFIDELRQAKEAFITGTTKKVMPVYQVDEVPIGSGTPGPITMELQQLYDAYISAYISKD